MEQNTQVSGAEDKQEQLKARIEEMKQRAQEANEAIKEGRGILKLEKPIRAGGEDVTELAYDFTKLTGLDYTNAMDSDTKATQIYRISNRQALALFAAAAAKETKQTDARDIIERIGMTDAVGGVQLATLFFTASANAGRMRISRMQ